MAERRTPRSEILRQIAVARDRGARERKAGRRAVGARYDRKTGLVTLELTNGFMFGFPARAIPSLKNASADQIACVEVSPGGGALHWNELDVDLSVPGLLLSSVGRSEKLSELGRIAGRAKTRAKAVAARANGAKGGRPKKLATR